MPEHGRMPERLNGAHSKRDGPQGRGGSNPSPSARIFSPCSSDGRAPAYEAGGRTFDSCRGGQFFREKKGDAGDLNAVGVIKAGQNIQGTTPYAAPISGKLAERSRHRFAKPASRKGRVRSSRTLPAIFRVLSSVGRAPALQAGCRRFETVRMHQFCRCGPLVGQRIVYPPYESSILFIGARLFSR